MRPSICSWWHHEQELRGAKKSYVGHVDLSISPSVAERCYWKCHTIGHLNSRGPESSSTFGRIHLGSCIANCGSTRVQRLDNLLYVPECQCGWHSHAWTLASLQKLHGSPSTTPTSPAQANVRRNALTRGHTSIHSDTHALCETLVRNKFCSDMDLVL